MGNTQDKLPVKVQEELNKKYMEDFKCQIKKFEKQCYGMDSINTKLLFPIVTADHPHQKIHRTLDVFTIAVSEALTSPHIIMLKERRICFVFSALQPPYVETTNGSSAFKVSN